MYEVKFLGYLRLKKITDSILNLVAEDANAKTRAADATTNADAFAKLIQRLDDRSHAFVMREAANDRSKAVIISHEYSRLKKMAGVTLITLHTEMTSLGIVNGKNITD